MAQARDEAGNIWEVDAQGNAVRLIQPAPQQAQPLGPPDPTAPFQAPRAQADTQKAQADAALAAAQAPFAAQMAQAEVAKALAEAEKARAEAARDPSEQRLDRGKIGQFLALEKQLTRIKQLYDEGPGATRNVFGVLDYLPSDANSKFDSAGAGLSEVGLAAFRVPGVGSQSDNELRQFVMANTPKASDRDAAIQEKIRNLTTRLESTKQAWGVDPKAPAAQLLEQFGGAQPQSDEQVSAFDTLRAMGGGGPTEAVAAQDVGSGQTTIDPYPPAMVSAHDDMVRGLISQGGGRIDPQAYAQQRAQLFQEFNYQSDPQTSVEWATGVNQYLDAGGRTIPSGILPAERLMTATETMRNNLVNNPVGAAFTGGANAATLGSVQAFAPDEYMALGDAQPMSQLAGEIGGTIAGTAALGGVGRLGAAGVAPRLLGGGARGQFARNVATDAAYGGAFGGVTQGDPLTGAVFGAGGSAAGQGVNRGLGALVGGAQRSAAVEALRARGVPISVGRQLGLGRAEDLAMSVPGVGDMIRRRQVDSFEGFDDAAMREAGQSIGFAPTDVARTGVDEFQRAVSGAYGQAVQGVTAPLDRQFLKDMVPVRRMSSGMNQTNRVQLAEALRDAVQVPANAGAITPQQFQDAVSNLKALRSNAKTAMPNSAQTLRKAATQTINALEGAMKRAGGQSVVEGLQQANMANRGLNVIENAALDRGAVGTQAGAPGLFTPAQLLQSVRASERRGFGDLPGLRQLGEQGQEVLPSTVPNSGTADRTLALGLMGGALGVGGGAEYASTQSLDTTGDAAKNAAGIAALAAILGTRRGQSILEAGLFRRPQIMQQAGRGIRRLGGLFGSTGGAITLNQQ
jgi:hypothetical protein